MKKVFLTLMATFLVATTFSQNAPQNVAKECVLFEIFTGVGCPYCPAAANGIGQMMEEGLNIAPLGYHTTAFSTPEFYTAETNARAGFYNVNSYPTLKADGLLTVSGGGGASENMYSSYLSKYNQRKGITSPFSIDLSYSHVEGTANHQVVCTVNQVGESTASNLRIMIALSQSNIQRSWQGMTSLHHVVRDLVPSQTGTAYSGGTQTVTELFSVGSLPQEDCFLTAWVQDFTTKEVFQAVRISMDAPDYPNDIVIKNVSNLISNSCSGKVAPTVTVKNTGIFDVSSFDVVAKLNGVECYRFTWQGEPFEYKSTVDVNIPEFGFPVASETMELEFTVENPNGYEDLNLSGNSMTKTVNPAFETEGFIKIIFITDSKPEESKVDIINMDSGEIIRSFTYESANTTYTDYIYLPEVGCYQVAVFDEGGDGLNRLMGVFDNEENLLFSTGANVNQFTHKIAVEIVANTVNINELSNNKILISPNPSNGQFQITTTFDKSYQVAIYDVAGRLVYENAQFSDGTINLQNCKAGMYLIKVSNEKESFIKKMIVR